MTETPELRDHFVERRIFIGVDAMIIEKLDQVTLLRSTLRTGQSKDGRIWERWAHEDYHYFSARKVLKDGSRQFNVFRRYRSRKKWYFENVSPSEQPFNAWGVEAEVRAAIIRMHERMIGPVPERYKPLSVRALVTALAYPVLAEGDFVQSRWDGSHLAHSVPRGLGPAYRVSDARIMSERLFGKRRARKDVVKAVARSTPAHHAVAHAFRRHVPVDWLVEYLNTPKPPVAVSDLGQLETITLVDLPSRRTLLLNTFETRDRNVERAIADSFLLYSGIRDVRPDDEWVTPAIRKAKTWSAFHDELARIHRTLDVDNKPIYQDDMAQALDGLTIESIVVTSAKTTRELQEWGEAMSNCIGGYGSLATARRTYLFAVHRDGNLIANMEIAPDGEIRQLFGRFNQKLDEATDTLIADAITDRLRRAASLEAAPLAA